jgi:hypothetical protein
LSHAVEDIFDTIFRALKHAGAPAENFYIPTALLDVAQSTPGLIKPAALIVVLTKHLL